MISERADTNREKFFSLSWQPSGRRSFQKHRVDKHYGFARFATAATKSPTLSHPGDGFAGAHEREGEGGRQGVEEGLVLRQASHERSPLQVHHENAHLCVPMRRAVEAHHMPQTPCHASRVKQQARTSVQMPVLRERVDGTLVP